MKANHKKDHKQVVGFQEIILQPGQFIFGRLKAAEETGLSERNIRTCSAFLKKCGNLTIKATNKFSIVSIVNWDTYQKNDGETDQQSDQQVTSNRPATDQQVTTNKNKRTKEQKKNIPPKSPKKKKKFIPPTKGQVINYFIENEYDGNKGAEAFEFYACADWVDSRGNKVKNWKQKMRGVWFKDENKMKKNGSAFSGMRSPEELEIERMKAFE
jgi:hypothetical protein